jgi:hypothetical protein
VDAIDPDAWELEERALRRELMQTKRRLSRTEGLLLQAESQCESLQLKLRDTTSELAEARLELSSFRTKSSPPPPPSYTTLSKRRVEAAKRVLEDADPIESHFRSLASGFKSRGGKIPFLPGGHSDVSLNHSVPVKEYMGSTKLNKLKVGFKSL